MPTAHGTCDSKFDDVRTLFEQKISQQEELGAAICVNLDGKNVVDLWGGYADEARTRPWTEDTLCPVWSVTKVVTALAAAILIDRGLLNPEENVSVYWPEFGTNGKEQVKVWHILSHSSGVAAWEPPFTVEELYDVDNAAQKLASQSPWWTPGDQPGYHMLNFGHLVGELVRRTSGKSLNQFITDEITGPLGVDFRLGVPEADWPRTADITPPPLPPMGQIDPQSVFAKVMSAPVFKAEYAMTPGFRKAELGANNGFGTARATARIGSLISLQGTVYGESYLSPTTISQMIQERVSGQDLVTFSHLRFGLGVGLPVPETWSWIPEGRICFWHGVGGTILLMDLEKRMTIVYSTNKLEGLIGNERTAAYVRAVYQAVNATS